MNKYIIPTRIIIAMFLIALGLFTHKWTNDPYEFQFKGVQFEFGNQVHPFIFRDYVSTYSITSISSDTERYEFNSKLEDAQKKAFEEFVKRKELVATNSSTNKIKFIFWDLNYEEFREFSFDEHNKAMEKYNEMMKVWDCSPRNPESLHNFYGERKKNP